MPPGFSKYRVAVLRTCSRNGWTLEQWAALDEDEQIEWLAFDQWRLDQVAQIQETLETPVPKVKPDPDATTVKPIDTSMWLMLQLAKV